MGDASSGLSGHKTLFSNRFSTPDLQSQGFILRARLLDHLQRQGDRHRVFAFQGAPGQGKTILAVQFLQRLNSSSAWCRVGEEDQQAEHFLESLLQACCYGVGDSLLSVELHEQIQREGAEQHWQSAVKLFCKALESHVEGDFYLVLDDLHHLVDAEESLTLLKILLSRASNHIRLILLSRLDLTLLLSNSLESIQGLLINNQQLAFFLGEIQQLHEQMHAIPLSEGEAEILYDYTQGWPVAVAQYARHLQESNLSYQKLIGEQICSSGFINYLRDTALAWLPENLKNLMLQIVYLDPLTPELTNIIEESQDAEGRLQALVEHHAFIKPPLMGQEFYSLTPIWRCFLQKEGRDLFDSQHPNWLYAKLARHWQSKGESERAIAYYLKAENPQAASILLREEIVVLINRELSSELREVLRGLDTKLVRYSPWITLLMGCEWMSSRPQEAYQTLKYAQSMFAACHDRRGEMLSLSQQIYFHVTVDGRHQMLPGILQRVAELKSAGDLSVGVYEQVHNASLLNFANYFINPQEGEKIRYEIDELLSLVLLHRMDDLVRRIRLYRFLELILVGNLTSAKADMEFLYRVLMKGEGTPLERCLMFAAIGYWLNQEAEHLALDQLTRQVMGQLDQRLLNNSLSGTLFRFWQIKACLSRAEYQQAKDYLREALLLYQVSNEAPFAHYLKMYDLFLSAQLSDEDVTPQLEPFKQDRMNARLHLVMAAIYGHYQKWSEAQDQLEVTFQILSFSSNDLTAAGAYLHQGWLALQCDEAKRAEECAWNFSRVMREHGYRNCYLFLPHIAKPFFAFAVKSNIDPELFRSFSRRRMALDFDADGNEVPLLQIKSLGELSLSFDQRVSLKKSELTPIQRNLLALLISSKGQQMEVSRIERELWPDDEVDQARSKLDVTLTRFRSAFNKAFKPHKANTYLALKQGVLSFRYTVLDVDDFLSQGERGRRLYQHGSNLEASTALINALHCWHGEFCIGLEFASRISERRDYLSSKHYDFSILLAEVYEKHRCYDDAVVLLTELFYQNPGDEDLVERLTRLYGEKNQRAKSMVILKNHREALVELGLDE